jgi:hypothetical protein
MVELYGTFYPGRPRDHDKTRPILGLAGRTILAAVFDLNHPAHTVDWNFIHLSVANVVVIGLMLIVFVLAILLPFPGAAKRDAARRGGGAS